MVTDKIKQLQATRARMANLVKSITTQLNKELAGLPTKYGFEDAQSFAAAVIASSGQKRGRPALASPAGAPKAGRKPGRRKRAVITDETRAEVKSMVAAGKTGAEISKALGISMPSVHNVKKALGLVKSR